MGRRSFLKALAAGTATLAGARHLSSDPETASAPVTLGPSARIHAPGDVVEFDWPAGLDRTGARFVHRVDGRTVAVAPVPDPTGGARPRVRFVAEPAGGLLPGVHEFVVEAAGAVEALGGFRVAPFAFGC